MLAPKGITVAPSPSNDSDNIFSPFSRASLPSPVVLVSIIVVNDSSSFNILPMLPKLSNCSCRIKLISPSNSATRPLR